ncbi:MAG TPA: hypothetical protein VEV44_04910, partial [Pseudoneobacillus sp.]|nr:hypothetical protein [Pseudoneobacillus sp.]
DGEELFDDIPVQCKNYQGKVTTSRPLEDLERCIMNSDSPLAYLFILGDLSDDFQREFDKRLEELKNKYEKEIKWKIVGQEQIAKLYLNKIGSPI